MRAVTDLAHSILAASPPARCPGADTMSRLAEMCESGELELPLPGQCRTVQRWTALAGWGRSDLPLARLAEGHTDAVAILAEAGRRPHSGARYGVWAARSGGTGAVLTGTSGYGVLGGTVRFCSGAHGLDRALVVALGQAGSQVVDVALGDPLIRRVPGSWQTAGMLASDSVDVEFLGVPVGPRALVGGPGFYTARRGFWWGGAGVASVWLGGAAGVLDGVRAVLRAGEPDPHQLAHLGALHAELAATDALLARTATVIDSDPDTDHRTAAWTARASAERTCRAVLEAVPRLVGVAALTRGGGLSDRLADLAIYLRQHHGERDLAALGARVLDEAR